MQLTLCIDCTKHTAIVAPGGVTVHRDCYGSIIPRGRWLYAGCTNGIPREGQHEGDEHGE